MVDPLIDSGLDSPHAHEAKGEKAQRSGRYAAAWAGVIAGVLVLAALVDFVIQNGQSVRLNFLMFHGRTSLIGALVASAVAGALVVTLGMGLRSLARHRRARRASSS